MAQWVRNDLSGHSVLHVPHRGRRPRTGTRCAFCAGAEADTPPTLDQEPAAGAWSARAFDNAFPILDRHEVIVESPRHVTTFADLGEHEAAAAIRLWSRRLGAARAAGTSPLLYRNDGAAAGASLPHVHAQLVAATEVFPRLAHECATFAQGPSFERPRFWARRATTEGWIVGEPTAARFAGETWMVPTEPAPRFEDLSPQTLGALARVLAGVLRALAAQGLGAHNLVLHTAPVGVGAFHTHVEILPRRDGIGGFELGAGVFANPGP